MPAWLQHDWCSSFVLALGHFLWQGTLIGIVLAIALRATKAVSVRYWLSLAALLVMPCCAGGTLVWLWPENPGSGLQNSKLAAQVVDPTQTPELPILNFEDLTPASRDVPIPDHPPVTKPLPSAPQSASPSELPINDHWQQFAPWLTSGYFAGVALMLLRLVFGLWGGRRLRRRVHLIDDPSLLAAMRRQATALGLKLLPVLAYCERVTVPTVVGVLKPMILLPLTLTSGLSPEQMESVLAHELAHLRRYDHLVNLLQRVIESLLFFHPALWWVSHRIRDEREHCCDDLVVACGAMPLDYAKSLLVVAELSRRGRETRAELGRSVAAVSLLATGNRKPSHLRQRIARLLGESATPSLRVSPRALLLAIGIPVVAVIATIQSGASHPPPSLKLDVETSENLRAEDGSRAGSESPRVGRGSPDPALDPTAGLPNSDEETNQPNNANGDLRSNPAAGSGDTRRAQQATEEPTKTKPATQLADLIQRLMKEEQKYNRIEVIVRSHQEPLKVLDSETQEIEIVRRLIRDRDLSYYLEEMNCRVQETGTTSRIVHEETIQGRWWRQRIESNGPGAAKHSNDSLFVLSKPNHRLGPHTLALGYWLDRPESLSDILTDATPGRRKIIELLGEETISKERCVKLKERDVSAFGSKSYRLIWLALDKNLLPVRRERCDENVERPQPMGFTQVTEWNEVQPGIWFPKCIETYQKQKTANSSDNLESVRTHTLTVELVTLLPQIERSLFDKLGKPPSNKPSPNAKAKIEQGSTDAEARDTQAAAKTAPPEGLAFLKPYPKLYGLSLDMTEPQFLEIVKQQELKTRKTVEGEKVTHHIALGDGHTLIVMFDKDGKCGGIQRVRGEDSDRVVVDAPVANTTATKNPANSGVQAVLPLLEFRFVAQRADNKFEPRVPTDYEKRNYSGNSVIGRMVAKDKGFIWVPVAESKDRIGALPIERLRGGQVREALLADTPEHALPFNGKWSIEDCRVIPDPNNADRFFITLKLNEAGGAAVRILTKSHPNQPLAILVNNEIITAPIVREEFGRDIALTGNFTREQADKLAETLRAGAVKPRNEKNKDNTRPQAELGNEKGSPELRTLKKPALLLPDHWIVMAVGFDNDGKELVTASNQSFITIRRWDVVGMKLISEIKLQADKHGRAVRDGTLKFSGDRRRVLAATDAYVGIWETATGKLLKQLPFKTKEGIYDCAIDMLDCTPDLSVIVGHRALPGRLTLSYDAQVIVWDGVSGNVLQTVIDKGATDLKAIDLSTDGKRLVTTNGGGAKIWETSTGQLLRSIPNDNTGRKHSEPDVSSQYTSHVWSVQFSPDGKQLAMGDILGVKLLDATSGKLLQQLEGPYRYSSSGSPGLVFSKDGQWLARLGTQEKVFVNGDKHRYVVPIWSTQTGARLFELHTEANDAAFSDDGQRLAVVFSDMQQALAVWTLSGDAANVEQTAGPGPHSRQDRVEENGHYVGQTAAELIDKFQPTWGDTQLGLQYGIALTNPQPQRKFRSGERVPLVVFFRNTSDKPIKFDTAPDFFGNTPKVHNAKGEPIALENIPLLGHIPHYHEKLAPGEALGPFYLNFGLGENPRPGQQNWHPYFKTPVAGHYKLTHSVSINVASSKDGEPSKRDDITTGTIEFEIVAGD